MEVVLKKILFGTPEYGQMKALRISALLEPIGVPPTYIDPEKERNDVFIGTFQRHRIIGCCILTRKNDQLVQLRQMAIDPAWQGQGLGASLLRFAEAEAKKEGYIMLMMHARAAVSRFYEKCGYQKKGELFYEVGIAHYVMERSLLGG